jgi:hypothetical protein
MDEALDNTCEMRRRGEWIGLTIECALSRHSDKQNAMPSLLRAPGDLALVVFGRTNDRAHFEHSTVHPGCPRGGIR